jgi:hypothetical protein
MLFSALSDLGRFGNFAEGRHHQDMRLPMRLDTAIHRFLDTQADSLSPATRQWYARQLAVLSPLYSRRLTSLAASDLQVPWRALLKKLNAGRTIPVGQRCRAACRRFLCMATLAPGKHSSIGA